MRRMRFGRTNFGNAYRESCERKNNGENKNERTSHPDKEGLAIMRESRKSNKARNSECAVEAGFFDRRVGRWWVRRRCDFDLGIEPQAGSSLVRVRLHVVIPQPSK
jgi:hypothetical protein